MVIIARKNLAKNSDSRISGSAYFLWDVEEVTFLKIVAYFGTFNTKLILGQPWLWKQREPTEPGNYNNNITIFNSSLETFELAEC